MLDLIQTLPPGARVLDLGAHAGSFSTERRDVLVVRLDLERPHSLGHGTYVLADAARLPFQSNSFHLVISNHSLEHFPALESALAEVGRILRHDGVLYVSVPDATTVTDRIYRWLGRGGGHVNPFRSPGEVARLITRLTGFPLRSTTVLFSSLSFLNRYNFVSRPPRRIAFFAFGNERFLAFFTWALRSLDRRFGTRLSQYGWSFRFGNTTAPENPEVWVNVCVRCGSGHSEPYLRKHAAIRSRLGFQTYRCPACGGFNFLTPEFKPPAK